MEIKLIKDGGQYHLTIGEADAWLSAEDLADLEYTVSSAVIDAITQQIEAIVEEVKK